MLDERNPKRVLLLTQDLELCGAQRQLVELALGLDRTRYEVRIGTLEPGGAFAEDLGSSGVSITSFERYWRWDLSPAIRLATYLRRERIDLVHAFHSLPNFYSRFAGRLARTDVIISSLRGSGIEGWHRAVLDAATGFMCHALITDSEAGRDYGVRHGMPMRKITVIHNGINPSRFSCTDHVHQYRLQWNLSRFDRVIGMVAAMETRKDHRLLLQAMKEIVHHQPRTGLLLIGDGSLRPTLERFTQDEGLQDHVVFAGRVRKTEYVYSLFDVYVQVSSCVEGISNSILEAMSCALPVVATDVGGNREVVVDEVTGNVVPAGDQAGLTEAILTLLNDPHRRRQMGQAGFERVRDNFSLEAMVATTQHLYDTLFEDHAPSRQGSLASLSSKESPR